VWKTWLLDGELPVIREPVAIRNNYVDTVCKMAIRLLVSSYLIDSPLYEQRVL
jgi:hypothetical protein